jgi:hypothetical protein
MADRTVEHAALVPAAFPYNGDHSAFDPPQMVSWKCRCRQHVVVWVDKHIVLLGLEAEAFDPLHNGIIRLADGHIVIDVVFARLQVIGPTRRMSHELPPDYEMIGWAVAERVAHMPVPSCNPTPLHDQLEQAVFLRFGHIAEFFLMT